MLKSNYFHYRFIHTGNQSPMDRMYSLGRSNSTALSNGGICIGVFLVKDGIILNDSEDVSNANQIAWAFSRCSKYDNYWRKKARDIIKDKVYNQSEFILSQNYDYDTVKKIANHFVEVVNISFNQKRNGFFNHIKNSFNIDSWVENEFKTKDVVINVPPLIGRGGTT